MARYTLLPGNLPGGSDDVAGRWYIHDAEADILDKRWAGYASRQDALDGIIWRLAGLGDGPDLVSTAAIAQRAGQQLPTVYAWLRRDLGFPEPLIDFGAGLRRWAWADVAAWLASPRPNGRPRKG